MKTAAFYASGTTAFSLFAAFSEQASAADSCDSVSTAVSALLAQGSSCRSEVLAGLCSSSSSTTTVAPGVVTDVSSDVFVGSYYPNWFVYRKHYMGLEKLGVNGLSVDPDQASKDYVVFPSDVSALMPKLTHLYYAFLDLNENCYVVDSDKDASWYGETTDPTWISLPSTGCRGALSDMLALKSQYPHLKVLLSIGGWTFSDNFSRCAGTGEAGFKKMYDSFNFYTKGDWGKSGSTYAGVDFDWEHPASTGLTTNFDKANDWNNYADLLAYFRTLATSEGRTEAVFTSAVGLGDTVDEFLLNPTAAKKYCDNLDHINTMAYDLHGKWEAVTGHNAPFCQIDTLPNTRPAVQSLPWSVKDRLEALESICGPSKIALGLPNYSPAWTDVPNVDDGLYQTSTNSASFAGWSTFSDSDSQIVPQGIIAFWDLKASLAKDSSFQVFSKTCPAAEGVSVPVKWVYSATKKAFASYEDEETVSKKTEWARKKGYAGFFFWDISQDKDGVLLDAARSGFGVTETHAASGSATCRDEMKPDFTKNPDGSVNQYSGCRSTGSTYAVQSGDGCASIRDKLASSCTNGSPVAVGGVHSGMTACVNVCTSSWASGELWTGDTIYYVCDGDSLDEVSSNEGNTANGSNGASSGAELSCVTGGCNQCVRNASAIANGESVTDEQCQQQCIVDKITYWPCNTSCKCA